MTLDNMQGNCELQFPDALTSGIEGAPMLPQKPGQCLMAFDQIFLAAQSSAGRKIWMDNLYLRDSRGETNSSLSDWNPSDPANQIVVMLASGKQYDDLPASSARHLYLTNVTIQGNGVDGSRGLYNTGRLFAQGVSLQVRLCGLNTSLEALKEPTHRSFEQHVFSQFSLGAHGCSPFHDSGVQSEPSTLCCRLRFCAPWKR